MKQVIPDPDLVAALDRQTTAFKNAPEMSREAFIDSALIALAPLYFESGEDVVDKVNKLLLARAILKLRTNQMPQEIAVSDPPIKMALQQTLSLEEAASYLNQFKTEFAGTWVQTREDAQRHWVEYGRAEMLAGNRIWFVPGK